MKVVLKGVQPISFTDKTTGEVIEGTKLHVIAELVEKGHDMSGQRCAAVFTRIQLPEPMKLGGLYDLVYEQPLGSTKSRLVEVKPCQ